MRISIVIPTSGDRSKFVAQAQRLISRQTVQPDEVFTIQSDKGITGNYRTGFNKVRSGIVVCWEDDDFYPIDYLERIVELWANRYDIMGFSQTIYYHLGQRKYTVMDHPGRASMFATVIKAGLDINWPQDHESFLDLKLWSDPYLQKKLVPSSLAVGIKHGIGKSGGSAHGVLFPYTHEDQELDYLKAITHNDKFYINLAETLKR